MAGLDSCEPCPSVCGQPLPPGSGASTSGGRPGALLPSWAADIKVHGRLLAQSAMRKESRLQPPVAGAMANAGSGLSTL